MMRSAAAALLVLLAALAWSVPASADVMAADWDDDDGDGVADGAQPRVSHSADLVVLERPEGGAAAARRVQIEPADLVRVLADGRPVGPGQLVPFGTRRLALQALRPGRGQVRVGSRSIPVHALGVVALDARGRSVDLTRSHASLQRTPPRREQDGVASGSVDPDALRYVLVAAPDDMPTGLDILSLSADGRRLDALRDVTLSETPCPAAQPAGVRCLATPLIRAVADWNDARHPLVAHRSLRAFLGGALELRRPDGTKLQRIRIGGPRHSALGPLRRYRARLRLLLVRLSAGGAAPLGASDAEAVAAARGAVRRANELWGACGLGFGPAAGASVTLVDPPPPHLLVMGCEHGLPASGGQLRFRADGRPFEITVAAGTTPAQAARQVAQVLRTAGFAPQVTDNPRGGAAAGPTTDLSIRRASGGLVRLEPPRGGTVSTDASLGVCIGQVDLNDGLQHFGDVDAVVGTLEERTLLKAFDDGDPSTIDVYIVTSFARGKRIGESFIGSDAGVIRNAVIVDSAGLRDQESSFVLPHELGHVLLDDPGHSDDYGADTATRLMDADAAEPTAFGPSRLTVPECVRALRQNGPDAPVPLIQPWPLTPIPVK